MKFKTWKYLKFKKKEINFNVNKKEPFKLEFESKAQILYKIKKWKKKKKFEMKWHKYKFV